MLFYLRLLKSIALNNLGIVQMPRYITYLITWRCNSRCIFCDVWKKHAGDTAELNLDDIRSIFAQINNPDVVRITGGEPFLRQDLAEAINIINEVSNPRIIHITTNGLASRIKETMLAIKSCYKIHLKVSIDAIGEKHDKIRGTPNAYEKAMDNIKRLVEIRKSLRFHLGVNQAIVNQEDTQDYAALKRILQPYGIPIYASVAFDPLNSLYSDEIITDPKNSYAAFGHFSKEGLSDLISAVLKDGGTISNIPEKIVNQYHLQGMYNRFVHNKLLPHPRCVSLNNHLRILPNGDVPVCLYNGTVVGNLKENTLKDIWKSPEAKKQRRWIGQCPGCWQSCDSVVNALYTGDIWRGIFYRKKES